MTYAIDIVCIDAILIRLLRKLGLPETLPLIKLSPRIQNWIVLEAEGLRRNAMSNPTFAALLAHGYPLTRECYLRMNNVEEEDLDAEQESELPELFQDWAIEERVASVMFEIEIDNTLRRLSELADEGQRGW